MAEGTGHQRPSVTRDGARRVQTESTVGTPQRVTSSTHPGAQAQRPWLQPLRWGALALGLVLVGAAGTYLVAPPVAAPERVVQLKDAPDTADAATDAAPMPSVTGLSVQTLRVVLRDAGAGAVLVVTKTAPAPGPAGRVIAQEPDAGQPIGERVTVTTSTPMAMPAVTGKAFTQVRADLQRLGAVVRATPVIRPGVKIGTVLSSVPPAGATTPTVVTLLVADPGQALSLSDLGTQDSSNCSGSSSIELGPATATNGIECTITTGQVSYVEYALNSHALSMAFTAGYDTSAGRGTGTLRILGDGSQLARFAVGDTSTKQRVDVTGVGVLRIEATGTPANADNPPVVALGDAIVQGQPAEIDALAKQ